MSAAVSAAVLHHPTPQYPTPANYSPHPTAYTKDPLPSPPPLIPITKRRAVLDATRREAAASGSVIQQEVLIVTQGGGGGDGAGEQQESAGYATEVIINNYLIWKGQKVFCTLLGGPLAEFPVQLPVVPCPVIHFAYI